MLKVRWSVLALAGVVVCAAAQAATIRENFSSNPLQNGWQVYGDAGLFRWESDSQDLAVTWNSAQTNSYFYHPLGTVLTTNDDFSVEFDLTLADVTADNYGSELAVGFLHSSEALSPDFARTTGTSPDVAEFDYFPPNVYPPSLDATLIDQSNSFYFAYETAALSAGTTYHIKLAHTAGALTLTGEVFTNGQLYAALTQTYGAIGTDFRLDIFAISSYQDDGYDDSILAHGTVDNLLITLPPPPVQGFTGTLSNGTWQGQFTGQPNWLYTLERTVDFQSWQEVSATIAGTGGTLIVQDANPPPSRAFYRVVAQRP